MNKIFLTISICACIIFSGCDNWADDFNINKNVPLALSTDPASFIGAMLSGPIGDSRMEWVAFNSIHPVIAYWGRTVSLSQGARHRAWHDFDSKVWQNCYPTLTNVKNVRRSAEFSNLPQYRAVADIWESWIMCTLTNFYGDIPYFAAVKDTVVYTVDYDKQSEIYPAILAKLKIANDIIAANPVNIAVNSDYIYAGDITKWRKFANTLRLRMCMYMYNANPVLAKNIMAEIIGDAQKYPVFTSNDDNCMMHYDGSSNARTSIIFHENPSKWYVDLPISNVMIQRLITLKDPRLPIYAYPAKKVHTESTYILPTNPGTDKYIGHMYGLTTSDADAAIFNGGADYASTLGPWFRPLEADGLTPTEKAKETPCFLATYPEMLFFLAEAAQRGIISGDAKQYYENGVKAAFTQYGATFGTTKYLGAYADQGLNNETEYLAQPSVNWDGGRDKLTLIAEQKWIASFFLLLEPYFDHRRTMLPKLSCSNRAALSTDGSGTKFPSRADYPTSEELTNKEGWSKARKTGYDIEITGDNNRTLARMWLINNSESPDLQMPIYTEPLRALKVGETTINQYPGNTAFQAWWDANWKTLYWWEYE